ncbi:MAG: hypothetical protein JO248_03105, partial [Acidimicrobiia bacterium]|nr:hypothetical protein [Acidimicrobiia bacterium]
MPAQKVEPAQQDHQRHDCARKGAGDDGTQDGPTGENGDQAEENDEEQQQAAPLDGRHLLACRRVDERPVLSHLDAQSDEFPVHRFLLPRPRGQGMDRVGEPDVGGRYKLMVDEAIV